MTKIEARGIETARLAMDRGMEGMAAWILSGVYRGSSSSKTQAEVLALAVAMGIEKHEDFII
jgi:hypothetical protein